MDELNQGKNCSKLRKDGTYIQGWCISARLAYTIQNDDFIALLFYSAKQAYKYLPFLWRHPKLQHLKVNLPLVNF